MVRNVEKCWAWVLLALSVYVNACMAGDECLKGTTSITVGENQEYGTVQSAIDSIPAGNKWWVHIYIKKGIYREKVTIPKEKGCIFMEGEDERDTVIAWADHGAVTTCSTFTAYSNNIAVKYITFKNTYNFDNPDAELVQALAASLQGDKYSFYRCTFIGLQDTIWDAQGRHYFQQCYISGAVDFIWGFGQSLLDGCAIEVTLKPLKDAINRTGTITAQGRQSDKETTGFVFKNCNVYGDRNLLGRAYRPYSRVIFFNNRLAESVQPIGWDAWDVKGHEWSITFVEAHNSGPGADTAQRVPWMKKMSDSDLNWFTSLQFVDQDGWISRLPDGALA
ncbi:PREDICTED: probable pectinesterase 66 [Tarenaya hassleriana]|uniref:probable pectinesterase 66 n=1 Tax=Tarenaya hassleriana TaxID=28532 RepID=UPI00053C269F|nr:PREDICTED: probable pectinesterase 66 [Tarenaya hassleriana]